MPTMQEWLRAKMEAGKLDQEEGLHLLTLTDNLDHWHNLYTKYTLSENSFFSPDELLPDFVVLNNPPKFFKQMEQDGLRGYDYEFWASDFSCDSDEIRGYCFAALHQLHSAFSSCNPETEAFLDETAGWQHETEDTGYFRRIFEHERPNDPVNRYYFIAGRIFGHEGKSHTLVLSEHATKDREECILRSELMIILRYIIGRAAEDTNHQIVPVLSISIRAHFFRVVEAYYDGEKMHINYGEPIYVNGDLPYEELKKRMEHILRWCASTPQGDTTSFSSLKSSTVCLPDPEPH